MVLPEGAQGHNPRPPRALSRRKLRSADKSALQRKTRAPGGRVLTLYRTAWQVHVPRVCLRCDGRLFFGLAARRQRTKLEHRVFLGLLVRRKLPLLRRRPFARRQRRSTHEAPAFKVDEGGPFLVADAHHARFLCLASVFFSCSPSSPAAWFTARRSTAAASGRVASWGQTAVAILAAHAPHDGRRRPRGGGKMRNGGGKMWNPGFFYGIGTPSLFLFFM